MTLDEASCYRALRTRDPRFDGRFFVAVRSTGVFCRPVCPARTPRRENCLFVPSAAAAREAGFRPCLRCRPEAAPGTPAWGGTSATVTRALRLIDAGVLDGDDVAALAARLGVGERHLRRLFARHVGASPRTVASTRRVLFAKKLLDETELPMTEVAWAAGFGSVRRFNHAVRETWGCAPRELRARGGRRAASGGASPMELRLAYRPPLAWRELLAFLEAHAVPGVEAAVGDAWVRTVEVDGVRGRVTVRPDGDGRRLRVRLALPRPVVLWPVLERVRRLFDLGADPAAIDAHLAADPHLAPSVRARPGLRVPGAWDGYETAVRAVLGQQVTVRGALRLAGRLARRFGERLDVTGSPDAVGPDRVFPPPERLAEAPVEAIGIPSARAGAIRALARAVARGELRLDGSEDAETTRAALRALPGIGAWTADCVALRALGEPDAFPSGDLGLRRQLGAGAEPLTPERLADRAEAWRPWRAYAALHLWTDALDPLPAPAERSGHRGAPARSAASPRPAAPSKASSARLRSAPHA